MVLNATTQDCSGKAGFADGVVVALRPGSKSDVTHQGLWRYVCCQRRPTLTLPSCRYTAVTTTVDRFSVCLCTRN